MERRSPLVVVPGPDVTTCVTDHRFPCKSFSLIFCCGTFSSFFTLICQSVHAFTFSHKCLSTHPPDLYADSPLFV